MKIMKRGLFLLVALPLLVSGALSAAAANGFYVAANAGANFLSDSDASEPGATGTFEFDTGFAFSGAVGYAQGPWRAELDITYRENDFDSATVTATIFGSTITASGQLEGDASSLAFMANAYYDIDTGSPVKPYLGLGLGVARVDVNDLRIAGSSLAPVDADDTVFAFQVTAGASYEINPNLDLTLHYRYFRTADPEFDSGGVTTEAEYRNHSVMAGVRYRF
jgi:opacity protein-like surface antigen